MTIIKIKQPCGRVLFETEDAEDIRGAVRQALGAGVSLTGAVLAGADLADLHLFKVELSNADLRGANLSGTKISDTSLGRDNLTNVDLRGANLTGINLDRSNFTNANLRGAKLEDINLTNADLSGCEITRATLTGVLLTSVQLAQLGLDIPRVDALDQKVLAAITTEGGHLNMSDWHLSDRTHPVCGSTHCRAGWAIHLAGEAGYALEAKVGPITAGALIYLQSTGRPVPDFLASDRQALASIQHWA